MDEWGVIGDHTFGQELFCSLFDHFLPRWPAQRVLKSCHTLVVGVVKEAAKDRIVGDAELPTIISIGHVNNLNTVGQDWETMSLKKSQQDHFIRSTIDADERVQGTIE